MDYNKYDVLNECVRVLSENFATPLMIGEPIYITDVYNYLNDVIGVVGVWIEFMNVSVGRIIGDFILVDRRVFRGRVSFTDDSLVPASTPTHHQNDQDEPGSPHQERG